MVVLKNSVKAKITGEGVEREIHATGGKLMTVKFTFQKGAVGSPHSHPHEQVGYILKGKFEFEMDGKQQILNAGDSYYVKPDTKHGVIALEDGAILDVFTPQREDFL
jgi:quercetin dioxygenase-like cupin family protein